MRNLRRAGGFPQCADALRREPPDLRPPRPSARTSEPDAMPRPPMARISSSLTFGSAPGRSLQNRGVGAVRAQPCQCRARRCLLLAGGVGRAGRQQRNVGRRANLRQAAERRHAYGFARAGRPLPPARAAHRRRPESASAAEDPAPAPAPPRSAIPWPGPHLPAAPVRGPLHLPGAPTRSSEPLRSSGSASARVRARQPFERRRTHRFARPVRSQPAINAGGRSGPDRSAMRQQRMRGSER